MNDLKKQGVRLSWLLRHDKDSFNNGTIDKNGWRSIDELVAKQGYTKDLIEEIVSTNDKKRYEYNEDKTYIRARQGHSIPVDAELVEVVPPNILYHGTGLKNKQSILENGIEKRTRLYVHLSKDRATAITVGKRHGEPFVFEIDAKKMYEDGCKFYLSNNGVYLTDYVSKNYFKN